MRRIPNAVRAGWILAAGMTWLALGHPLPGQEPMLPQPVMDAAPEGPETVASADGTLDLSWSLPGEVGIPSGQLVAFELEETLEGGETTVIDTGPHLSTALSGRDDGLYRYRVRAVPETGSAGPWSEPIELRVQHHSLSLAFTLFSIGAAVFLATAALVLIGHARSRSTAHGG